MYYAFNSYMRILNSSMFFWSFHRLSFVMIFT
nr:MAG TPA: hypothetical protein [Caudoviricetes sp.]